MNRRSFLISAAATAGAAQAAATAGAAQAGGVTLVVNAPSHGALNLRSGPGTAHPILMQMYNDDWVDVLASSGNWREVRHQSGVVGWAHGRYLVE